jgi:hypothetical protein
MKELTKSLNDAAFEGTIVESDWPTKELRELHESSKRWAAAACDTYTGPLLKKALGISVAISEFTAALVALEKRKELEQ